MSERSYETEQMATEIFGELEDKKELLLFLSLLNDRRLKKQCGTLVYAKGMVIKSMQMGNYRRAMIYLLGMKQTLNNLSRAEVTIKSKVTAYILEE